jgi:hypothetical protein
VQVLSGDKVLNEDGKILACSCAAWILSSFG